jgi:hypothetical protein
MKKPDDVDETEWSNAVKSAANQLLTAYGEMDETAPDSLYEAAGKTAPKKKAAFRAKNISDVFWSLATQATAKDSFAWLNDLYVENGKMFAIIASNGKLFRADVTFDAESLGVLGEWTEVQIAFPPVEVEKSRTVIRQQPDGRYRWVSISCSAALNRVGELDSRALFDSFIANAERTGDYPIRQFYHAGEQFRTGIADFVGRDDYLLITSGLYDETELAQREVKARLAEPEYWGDSIGYLPTCEPAMISVAEGISIPAYDAGILREISTLPEAQAASWMTATPTIFEEVERMLSDKQLEAFVKLFVGETDPEAAAKKWLEENADTRNRTILASGMITRETTTPAPVVPVPAPAPIVPEPAPGPALPVVPTSTTPAPVAPVVPEPVAGEYQLSDEAAKEIARLVAEQVDIQPAIEAAMTKFQAKIDEVTRTFEDYKGALDKRLKPIEEFVTASNQQTADDMPVTGRMKITYRPRKPDNGDDEPKPETFEDVAKATMESFPVKY